MPDPERPADRPDLGMPVAFSALPEGVPAYATPGGERLGTVARVLVDEATGIFDGLALDTPDGPRFVDAPEVGDLGTDGAEVRHTPAEVRGLPEPPAPAGAAGAIRRALGRLRPGG